MHRFVVSVAFCALLLALLAPAAFAQGSDEDLRQEIEALKKGQQQIQKDLQEIKQLIKSQPKAAPPPPAGPNVKGKVFDLGANPVKGERTAQLTLVEFTDYQ